MNAPTTDTPIMRRIVSPIPICCPTLMSTANSAIGTAKKRMASSRTTMSE